MSGFGIPFVEDVPEYAVRNEVMYVTVQGRALCAMPLRTFKIGALRSAKVIQEYERSRATLHCIEQARGCKGCENDQAASP